MTSWAMGSHRSVMGEKQLHDRSKGGGYPWRAVHACSENEWDEEFAFQFPKLVEYVDNFPTNSWKRICVISQLADSEVFLHTDPDAGVGWRIYLNHGGPRLYFQRFKERHSERPQTWASGGPAAIADLCHGDRVYVDDEGVYPWALTSIRAAHGVERNTAHTGARTTMLLFPHPEAVDHSAHQELLLRSAERYKSTTIWY